MKFSDGFDTDREDESCIENYRVVTVETDKKIVAACINNRNTCMRFYCDDGSWYDMPIYINEQFEKKD